jgi:hypothetical protein
MLEQKQNILAVSITWSSAGLTISTAQADFSLSSETCGVGMPCDFPDMRQPDHILQFVLVRGSRVLARSSRMRLPTLKWLV